MFPLRSIPLLLTTVYKRLETEESSCWMFGKGMLSHCCLIEDLNCSTHWLPVGHSLSKVVCPDWTVWWDGSGPKAICLTARPLVLVASPLCGHVQKHVLLVVVSEMLSTNRAAAPTVARLPRLPVTGSLKLHKCHQHSQEGSALFRK